MLSPDPENQTLPPFLIMGQPDKDKERRREVAREAEAVGRQDSRFAS